VNRAHLGLLFEPTDQHVTEFINRNRPMCSAQQFLANNRPTRCRCMVPQSRLQSDRAEHKHQRQQQHGAQGGPSALSTTSASIYTSLSAGVNASPAPHRMAPLIIRTGTAQITIVD